MTARHFLAMGLVVAIVTAAASAATWTWRRGHWQREQAAAAAQAARVAAADALEIREVVLRDVLARPRPGEIRFIAFVREDGEFADPPAGFLQRLSDLKLELEPVSRAVLPGPTTRGIQDAVTGRPGRIYVAHVTKLGPRQSDVTGGTLGFEAISRYDAIVRKQDSTWALDPQSKKHDIICMFRTATE